MALHSQLVLPKERYLISYSSSSFFTFLLLFFLSSLFYSFFLFFLLFFWCLWIYLCMTCAQGLPPLTYWRPTNPSPSILSNSSIPVAVVMAVVGLALLPPPLPSPPPMSPPPLPPLLSPPYRPHTPPSKNSIPSWLIQVHYPPSVPPHFTHVFVVDIRYCTLFCCNQWNQQDNSNPILHIWCCCILYFSLFVYALFLCSLLLFYLLW